MPFEPLVKTVIVTRKDQGEIWGITEGQQNLKQEKGTDQMGDMCPDLAYVRVQMEVSVVL